MRIRSLGEKILLQKSRRNHKQVLCMNQQRIHTQVLSMREIHKEIQMEIAREKNL